MSVIGTHLGSEQLARVEDLQAHNAALVIKVEIDHAADLLWITQTVRETPLAGTAGAR